MKNYPKPQLMKLFIFHLFLVIFFTSCDKNDDNGNNTGDNNNCQWTKASDKIDVLSDEMGTICNGSPLSVNVTIKNVSDRRLRIAICFEQYDNTWVTQSNHELDPGEIKDLSICDYGTGNYQYWTLDAEGNADCAAPNCLQ